MIQNNYDYRFKSELSAEYGLTTDQVDKIIDLPFKQMKEVIENIDLSDRETLRCFMFPILGKIFISEKKKDKIISIHNKQNECS